MTEEQGPNHWDNLIASLGVTPSPQEEGSRPLPHFSALPRLIRPASPPPSVAPKPPPTDWDRIADQLGLKAPPDMPPMASDEKPPLDEASLTDEEATPEAQVAFAEQALPKELGEEEERLKFVSRRQRKRKQAADKRRRRRHRQRPAAKHGDRNAEPIMADYASLGPLESDDRDLENVPLQTSPATWPAEQEPAFGLAPAEQASLASVAADEVPPLATDSAAGAEQTAPSPRTVFRGIPSWEEVVGIIIANNMANRQRTGNDSGRSGRQTRK